MLSILNKLISSVLSFALFIGVLLGFGSPPISPAAYSPLEKDYVHCWNSMNAGGKNMTLNYQTEHYALQTDGRDGTIISLGAYKSKAEGTYTDADFSSLFRVLCMRYTVDDGSEYRLEQKNRWHRLIESGRYVARSEYNELTSDSCDYVGRMEVSATQRYFSIIYEVFSNQTVPAPVTLSWSVTFKENLSAEYSPDGRAVTLKTADGRGLTFAASRVPGGAQFDFSRNTLTVTNRVSLETGRYAGFVVFVFASNSASLMGAQVLYDVENAQVSATGINPACGALPVRYDEKRGIYVVDISTVSLGPGSDSSNFDDYERVLFSIKNNSGRKILVPVTFEKPKSTAFSVTGMSPVIRDPVTLEPAGIQVQISKNWHYYSKLVPADDYKRNNEGQWYRGSTEISVEAGAAAAYEYTCAYGRWGGVYAASHAQLCLIGWDDNCFRWDQAALGSWGESVCYALDKGIMRSHINDVRPFMVTSPLSAGNRYGWTGNVGGADFLCYSGLFGQKISQIQQKTAYKAQGPNLTDAVYSGFSADGKIKFDITVNMGRTDDVVRVYYTLHYTFLQDTYAGSIALFKLGADGYADNTYTRYAYGDSAGAYETDKTVDGLTNKYLRAHKRMAAAGDDFWFSLYAATNDEENGDSVMIVREYSADINGRQYDTPSYTICDTNDGGKRQAGCEISLPKEAGLIVQAGSSVHMTLEHLVLPSSMEDYYGESSYLTAAEYAATAGTWQAAFKQVTEGAVACNADTGTVVSQYPVEIKSDTGAIPAQFSLTGGLGYTPVKISGLQSYGEYILQMKTGSGWATVSQAGGAGNKNDFWQTQFDSETGTYSRTYNLENSPSGYSETHEYRLIKIPM